MSSWRDATVSENGIILKHTSSVSSSTHSMCSTWMNIWWPELKMTSLSNIQTACYIPTTTVDKFKSSSVFLGGGCLTESCSDIYFNLSGKHHHPQSYLDSGRAVSDPFTVLCNELSGNHGNTSRIWQMCQISG